VEKRRNPKPLPKVHRAYRVLGYDLALTGFKNVYDQADAKRECSSR
jgi:hypothetical protein